MLCVRLMLTCTVAGCTFNHCVMHLHCMMQKILAHHGWDNASAMRSVFDKPAVLRRLGTLMRLSSRFTADHGVCYTLLLPVLAQRLGLSRPFATHDHAANTSTHSVCLAAHTP